MYGPSEEQALATVAHAAEEIRFFKGQQWHVTNYALLAYAALVAAPSWVEPDSWRCGASWGALLLVWGTFAAALWQVLNLEVSIEKERRRLQAARNDLPLMRDIHGEHRIKKIRSETPWRRWFFWRRHHEQGTDDRPPVRWIFFVALTVGLMVASVIILSRIPSVQRVVACISI